MLNCSCSFSVGYGVYVAYPDARALGPKHVNPVLGVPKFQTHGIPRRANKARPAVLIAAFLGRRLSASG